MPIKLKKISKKLRKDYTDLTNSLALENRLTKAEIEFTLNIEDQLVELHDYFGGIEDIKQQYAAQLVDFLLQEADND